MKCNSKNCRFCPCYHSDRSGGGGGGRDDRRHQKLPPYTYWQRVPKWDVERIAAAVGIASGAEKDIVQVGYALIECATPEAVDTMYQALSLHLGSSEDAAGLFRDIARLFRRTPPHVQAAELLEAAAARPPCQPCTAGRTFSKQPDLWHREGWTWPMAEPDGTSEPEAGVLLHRVPYSGMMDQFLWNVAAVQLYHHGEDTSHYPLGGERVLAYCREFQKWKAAGGQWHRRGRRRPMHIP